MEIDKILKIENQVYNTINAQSGIGLLSGLSGTALFYSYLFEVYQDKKYETRLIEVIELINKLVTKGETLPTFCSGLAGYGWMLLNLNNETIDISKSYFKTLDGILEEALFEYANKNNYDFLHGATGVAMYFIERLRHNKSKEKVFNILNKFSKDLLYKINHDFENIVSPYDNESKTRNIYFGLAHGISGLINFLFYLSQNMQTLEQEIKLALTKLIQFLESKKKYSRVSQQYYPSHINSKGDYGYARLGWCQGDLGIGLALNNAATILKDNALKEEAKALITASENISLKVSSVYDFSFCHGSVGLVIQYYLAQEKHSLNTKESQKRWYQELENQTSNFTIFKAYSKKNYIKQSNIIVGASGLGLSLLTLEGRINNDWLKCFNLY